jgi:chaperonin GroEL (HSP60 family)
VSCFSLREFAHTSSGKEQLAIEAFANAIESIPETLAENAGLDAIDILTQLRKRHQEGYTHEGLNLLTDTLGNCAEAGIVEPLKVKTQAISSATEVATMLLRIDDVLVSSKKDDSKEGALAGLD